MVPPAPVRATAHPGSTPPRVGRGGRSPEPRRMSGARTGRRRVPTGRARKWPESRDGKLAAPVQ